ncbi:MAG: hypothetical protein DME98_04360 [Verrucomicrobia bacterium]|nr:MAG: hypothetical protein DME98_04360 [Verrucomicrobiota bacterium]PYJ34503.1 MAG: hypothetical protein DME88_04915 [Verrucomicrobiota bacterium]
MISAKGAMSAPAWRQRPRNSIGAYGQALKARFSSCGSVLNAGHNAHRKVDSESFRRSSQYFLYQIPRSESRFQRCCFRTSINPGALPQVRHGEWSRRDASDIDGLSREAEMSGSE